MTSTTAYLLACRIADIKLIFVWCMLLPAHAGAWTSKQIKASHRLEDLQSRQVNIVHVLRPEAAVQGVPAGQLLVKQQSTQVGARACRLLAET
jgi:hypothetical protein